MTSLSDRLKSRGIFVVIVYCIGITGVSLPASLLSLRATLTRSAKNADYEICRLFHSVEHSAWRQPDQPVGGRPPSALFCLLLLGFGRILEHPPHQCVPQLFAVLSLLRFYPRSHLLTRVAFTVAWIANNSPNESQRAVSQRDPVFPFFRWARFPFGPKILTPLRRV